MVSRDQDPISQSATNIFLVGQSEDLKMIMLRTTLLTESSIIVADEHHESHKLPYTKALSCGTPLQQNCLPLRK